MESKEHQLLEQFTKRAEPRLKESASSLDELRKEQTQNSQNSQPVENEDSTSIKSRPDTNNSAATLVESSTQSHGDSSLLPIEDRSGHSSEDSQKENIHDTVIQDSSHDMIIDSVRDLSSYTFKTSNRIISDIRLDIPAMMNELPNLLTAKPINYSETVASIKSNPYEIVILNNLVNYAPNIETVEHDDILVTTIRGLIVNTNEVKLSTSAVYHIKIRLVGSGKIKCHKHEFHEISDEIVPDVYLTLLDSHMTHVQEGLPEHDQPENFEHIKASLPKILDRANFECATCNKLMRVEIFAPEFDKDDLYSFEIGTIQVRYTNALPKYPELPQEIPSPSNCLYTLFKVLRGPLIAQQSEDVKTIKSSNASLNSHLDLDILFKSLYFNKSADGNELIPPCLFSYGEYNELMKDSYYRKILEIIYLGRKSFSGGKQNQFQVMFSFSDNNSFIYRTLSEFDFTDAINHQNDAYNNNVAYINFSCCHYFSDDVIKQCYEATVKSDPANEMIYIDSLKDLAFHRNTPNLQLYCSRILSRGDVIGYRELLDAYATLKIDGSQISDLTDDLIIATYKAELNSDPNNYSYLRNNLKTIGIGRKSAFIENFLENELLPVHVALNTLNCEEVTEDEVVITAYEFKKEDFPNETYSLNKAVLSIAVARRSYLLLDFIEMNVPELNDSLPSLTYDECCNILGCDVLANDFQIITVFQVGIQQTSSDVRMIRHALKTLAKIKGSNILTSFLKTGIIDPKLLPSENWPIGLDNIGNTCYLNSLLQYYFVIKPLRDSVLKFSEYNIDKNSNLIHKRRIGGRIVTQDEVERSYQFVYQLRDLFDDMIRSKERCVTPKKELAYLAFSHISDPVEFKGDRTIMKLASPSGNKDSDGVNMLSLVSPSYRSNNNTSPISIPSRTPERADSADVQMDDVFDGDEITNSGLAESFEVPSISPENSLEKSGNSSDPIEIDSEDGNFRELIVMEVNKERPEAAQISLDQMENALEIGRQQDVTECIENVMGQFETAFEPERLEEEDNNEQYDIIKFLFYGKYKQLLVPVNGSSEGRKKIERFSNLIINISDHPKDIYDALDNYFAEDLVTIDNEETKKSLTITELPQIFQFQINRVLFDRERLVAYKSIDAVPFGEKLYMDRYLDTEDKDIIGKREEVFNWKSEIRKLKARKDAITIKDDQGMSIREALISARDFLENELRKNNDFDVEEATIKTLDKQINIISEELFQINNSISNLTKKVESQFSDYKKVGYSIFAIFIHRGEASYGHYWIYIRDPKTNVYRKYNDETVTEVPSSEVFNFNENNTATPYFMVYVKDEFEREYIEPLKREIEES